MVRVLQRPGEVDEGNPGRHVVGRERLERLIEGARGEQLDAAGQRAVQHGRCRRAADSGRPAGDVGPLERAPEFLVVELRDVVDAERRLAQDGALGVTEAPRRRRMSLIVRDRGGSVDHLGSLRRHRRDGTLISDLEVDERETRGHLWHIRYPIEGEPGRHIVVATTRPETMLGDTGVAVHPEDRALSPTWSASRCGCRWSAG